MEATIALETQQITAQSDDLLVEPSQSGNRPAHSLKFSAQNAREMALRMHEKRKQRLEALRIAADPCSQDDEEYRKSRIARTRTQIEALDKELSLSDDPRAIKALCESIAKLAELERMLSMRPAPGAFRPTNVRQPKRNQSLAPLESPDPQ